MNGAQAMSIRELSIAWDWVLRLRDDAVTQDNLNEWLRWYEADERHRDAFEEMQTLWRGAAQVIDGPGAPTIARLLGESSSSFRRKQALGRTRSFNWLHAPGWIRGGLLVGLATALVVAVSLWIWRPHATPQSEPLVRRQVLADGSRIELAAKSSVDVQYTARERALELKEGEAFFSVARNGTRPFVVKVGELRIRALGTAFNIRKAGKRIVVVVTEGSVEVLPSSVRVVAGRKAIWDTQLAEPAIAPTDVAHTLAWRQGRLEYLNEPLSAVIADVNRYAKHKVIIRDEAVSRIVFSGTVFADATDVWLQALPRVFPVEVLTDGSGNLVLAQTVSSEIR
jgi:transmembrane sensor